MIFRATLMSAGLAAAAIFTHAPGIVVAQTPMGTCVGTVGVVTEAAGVGSVYCTPTPPPPPPQPPPPPSSGCNMQLGGPVIFCDTFDAIGNRAGDLDGNVWGGVSGLTGNANFGQGFYNGWTAATLIQTCSGTATVSPPMTYRFAMASFARPPTTILPASLMPVT
jgi:hypothetical protein